MECGICRISSLVWKMHACGRNEFLSCWAHAVMCMDLCACCEVRWTCPQEWGWVYSHKYRVECPIGCGGLDICIFYQSLAYVLGSGFVLEVVTVVLECVLVSVCPGGISVINDVLYVLTT